MRIDQIKQVIEVAKTKSINKASQSLFMAQSSLSSSINSLEKELGKDIFTREQNRLEITEFGEKFIQEGTEILKHYQMIQELAEGKGIYSAERFSVSVYYLLFAVRVFAEMCDDYDKSNKRVNFSVREQSRMDVIEDVHSGKSDLGILSMPSLRKDQWLALLRAYDLDYVKLSYEPPYIIYGKNTELYHKDIASIDISFFQSKRLIMSEESNELFQSIERELMKKYQYGSYLGLTDRGTFTFLLNQLDVYYLVTYDKAAYQKVDFYENLKTVPVTGMDDFHFEIGYLTRHGEPLSELTMEYIDRLKTVMDVK